MTEREIQNGILRAKDTSDHTLAYIRNIEGLNVSVLRYSKLFVDIAGRNVDTEAQTLLDRLRDKKIPAALTEENIARYVVHDSFSTPPKRAYNKVFNGQFVIHHKTTSITASHIYHGITILSHC